MGEAKTTYTFSYKEVVEALIKQQGIHEGIWAIYVRFGLGAVNIKDEDSSVEAFPSAIVPVREIGIQKAEKVDGLSVDAAEVNARPKTIKKRISKNRPG